MDRDQQNWLERMFAERGHAGHGLVRYLYDDYPEIGSEYFHIRLLRMDLSVGAHVTDRDFLFVLIIEHLLPTKNRYVTRIIEDAESNADAVRAAINIINNFTGIPWSETYSFGDGRIWAVSSGAISDQEVIIPLAEVSGLSDEEIGKRVRGLASVAFGVDMPQTGPFPQIGSRPTPVASQAGYVYLIHGVGTQWYKIGLSKNPEVRASQLGTKGPFKYDLIHFIETENASQLEQEWHERFADKRAQGEWFVLSEDDIREFTEYRNEQTAD